MTLNGLIHADTVCDFCAICVLVLADFGGKIDLRLPVMDDILA